MSADQMTRDELIAHHAERVIEATKQAAWLASAGWPEAVASILDNLAYVHAVDAAHAARSTR